MPKLNLTEDQRQAIEKYNVDVQTICLQAITQAVEVAALRELDVQANEQRRVIVEEVAATFAPVVEESEPEADVTEENPSDK